MVGRDRAAAGLVPHERLEETVERDDLAAEEAAAAREQVALDTVDVRRIRHDQNGLVVEARQIALEEERHFARVGRPCEKGEPHLPIVERAQDDSRGRPGRLFRCERPCLGGGGLRAPAAPRGRPARHLAGALVAEVGDFRAAARVRIGHAEHGALCLFDFLAAAVANGDCFPSQFLLLAGFPAPV